MKPDSVVVKYRTVAITLFPWSPRPGVVYWKFRHGKKHIVRSTLEKARAEAKRIGEETFLGTARLGALTTAQTQAIRRMLAVDPQLTLVDDFLAWHSRAAPKKSCRIAVAEFIAVKVANAGLSHHHVANLTRHLAKLPDLDLSEITPAHLPVIPGIARTRRNVIGAWVTFFRWAQRQGYLPHGIPTAPELLERPLIQRAIPTTYTPAELRTLLHHVAPAYLPWLALAAWAGLRTEEVCPDPKSKKGGLLWEDFAWDRDLIIIRPEVAKTGRRRIVPILPALRAMLWPLRSTGRVGPALAPHTPQKGGVPAETSRLGKTIGGWKRNALRHSFISYRAAQVGLAQTSMEAGNSEAEARRSYNDAKGKDEAFDWFANPSEIPQKYPSPTNISDFPVSAISATRSVSATE
jgi:integrase